MSELSETVILDKIDSLKDEIVQMILDIVSHPSELGNEKSVQDFMQKKFQELDDPKLVVERLPVLHDSIKDLIGYSPVDWKYFEHDENKVNIVATRKVEESKGKTLIFNGHVDVVPTGPLDMWTRPPFEPYVFDGRVYGRGSGDMKSGIVAFYYAYKALLALGYVPASSIQMQTVIEEECTGNGTLALVKNFKADCVIIPEPFNHTITTAQLGVLWMQVRILGKPAHVLDTSAGVNAIEACYQLVTALKTLETKWNDPSIVHPLYKEFKHPINFNMGKIQGGEWASSVPASSSFDLRVGFFPTQNLNEVKKEIEMFIDNFAQEHNYHISYSYNGFHAEGAELSGTQDDMFKLLGQVHKDVTSQDPVYTPVTCTTDARFFSLYENIPSTCYGPEAKSIHGIDESVSIESVIKVTKVLALFIVRWCKLECVSN